MVHVGGTPYVQGIRLLQDQQERTEHCQTDTQYYSCAPGRTYHQGSVHGYESRRA